MMFRKNSFIKRMMVLFLAFVLTFNTKAFYVFANSLDNVEETVEEVESIVAEDENNVEEPEEINVGEATSFPDQDAEEPEEDNEDEPEEDILEEDESSVAEVESGVAEDESNVEESEENKVEEIEENNAEETEENKVEETEETNVGEAISFPEENADETEKDIVDEPEEDKVEETADNADELESSVEKAESTVDDHVTTERESEIEIELELESKEIKEGIYNANPNINFTFNTNVSGVTEDAEFVYHASSPQEGDYSDITISSGTSFRNKNVGDVITAPTVTIASSESSKGLSFKYWKNVSLATWNGGVSRALTESDFSSPRYYACFTDNRKTATISLHADSESKGSFFGGHPTWRINGNSVQIRHAINDVTYNELINEALRCNAGYGFDKIVNSSGTEVDPKSWNRNSDVTYYIVLKTVGTPVSFDLGGHGSIDDQVVTAGDKVTKPDDPDVTGYTFGGWYKDSGFTTQWNFSTDTVGSDPITLYGKFVEKDYSITYNRNGGAFKGGYTAPTSRQYTEATTLPTADNIEKAGHTFGGWYENADFSGSSVTSIPANTDANKVFYLKWTENEYNITLNNNGGTYEAGYTAPTTRLYSSATTLPTSANITKTGYTFGGWYVNADFSGTSVTSIPANTAEDKTYYLKWNENEYNITLNRNGGTYETGYTAPTKRKYSDATTLPTNANITKTGHTFGGWYENADFSGSSVSSIPSNTAGNKTYYLKWTANTYNITYNLNGGTIQSGNVTSYTYGVGATLPTDVVKSDTEKFIGWYEASDFSGSIKETISKTDMGDKTYYAKYGLVYYVTYEPGEGSGTMAKKPVEEGKAYIVADCGFTHESLVFDKWEGSDGKIYNKGKSVILTGDLTLTALWKEKPKPSPGGTSGGGQSSGGKGGGNRISINTIIDINNVANSHKWKYENGKWTAESLIDGSIAKDRWLYMNYRGSNGWYYFDSEGNLMTRWRVIGDRVYYFEDTDPATYGMMYTGERVVEGKKRLFAHSGEFIRDLE